MNDVRRIKHLTQKFEDLGVDDPVSWATSEVEEGIPQLLNVSIVKAFSEHIAEPKNMEWINYETENTGKNPDSPHFKFGKALQTMLDAGVDKTIINDFYRYAQAKMMVTT
ncbi:MAG: hypothetical protein AAF705_12785 [Bacteroidota bacterium]